MARNKLTLARIPNDATRRSTLRKRGRGLEKKARELSTLCDVDVCLVVFGEGESSKPPEVWPSPLEARRVIERFKSMPEVEQCHKMLDQVGLMRERVAKLQEQLRRAERDNRERETTLLLHDAIVGHRPGLAGLTIEELVSIGWMAEDRVRRLRDHIAYMRGQQGVQVQPPAPPYATTGADVEAPHQQGRWVMEVVRAGLDIDAVDYSGSGSGNGSHASVGAGGDVMQLGNLDAGLAWTDPGASFHPV